MTFSAHPPATVPPPLAQLTPAALRALVDMHGYDAAIELLHRAIRATPPHADFIRRVESASAPFFGNITLAIVPGALFREVPNTGANGKRFIDIVRALGINRCDTIPIQSLGTLAQNARILTDWLAAHPTAPGEKRILVSFSKGSADIKAALQNPVNHPAFHRVHAWLSIGGLLHGTPLIAWVKARPLSRMYVWLYLRLRGASPRAFHDLAHGAGTPLDAPTVLPAHLPLIHLVTLPTRADLSLPLAHRAFDRLLPLGPNDAGGLLLGDLARFPGMIYPLQGADHYLRGCPALPDLLQRILAVAADLPHSHVEPSLAFSPTSPEAGTVSLPI